MTNLFISNTKRITSYYSLSLGELCDDISNLISSKSINSASLDAHIKNTRNSAISPNVYIPVVEGIYPIPPRSCWQISSSCQFNKVNNFNFNLANAYSAEDFFSKLRRYGKNINDGHLGIESSGGLDSALIAIAFRYLGLDSTLASIKYQRYEFRTENIIQDRIKADSIKDIQISGDLAMVFSSLLTTPIHILPSASSLYSNRHVQVANACSHKGIKILLNGNGGDLLLCNDFRLESSLSNNFESYYLDDPWANNFIYKPRGIHYLSGFCLRRVLNSLHNMRIGKGEDVRKLWARDFFKKYLPIELSAYSYKSAFDGLTSEAVDIYADDIRYITRMAFDLTGHRLLSDKSISNMISEFDDFDTDSKIIFYSAVSFSNWVYGLLRDGYI